MTRSKPETWPWTESTTEPGLKTLKKNIVILFFYPCIFLYFEEKLFFLLTINNHKNLNGLNSIEKMCFFSQNFTLLFIHFFFILMKASTISQIKIY